MKPLSPPSKWVSWALFFLLFFSGATGLVYQVVWFRVMHYSFGTTQLAITAVLAAYMVGMGLGSALAGKLVHRVRRPALVYALLEAVIGFYALAVTPLLYQVDFIFGLLGANPSPAGATFFRLITAFLMFLVPTAAMGATLPVLSRALVTKKKAGGGAGRLYAINTLGAVVGCLLAGFITIRWLGLDGSLYLAAAGSLAVAALSAALHFAAYGKRLAPKRALGAVEEEFQKTSPKDDDLASLSPSTSPSPSAQRSETEPLRLSDQDTAPIEATDPIPTQAPGTFSLSVFAAMLAALLGGAAALSNEVIWNRVLGMVLDGTVYGFSALLAAFLTGIALGSALLSPMVDKKPKRIWDLLIAIHLLAGVGAVITMVTIPLIPGLAGRFFKGGISPYKGFLLKAVFVFFTILLPTLFYGAAFPATVKLASKRLSPSQALARVYAANTAGSVVGVLMAGILLPSVGSTLQQSGLLSASLSFVTALALAWVAFVKVKATPRPATEVGKGGKGGKGGRTAFARPVPTKVWLFRFGVPAVVLMGAVALRPSFRIVHIMESRYAIEDYLGQLKYKTPELTKTPSARRVVYKAEGKQTIVTVRREGDGGYRLRNNGLNEAYHAPHEPHYAAVIFFLGTLPYMLHPNPQNALLIGLGTGGTAESLLRTDLRRLHVVELEPEVVKASRFIYRKVEGDVSSHPLEDDRSRLIVDDARNTLLRWSRSGKPRAYDLIVSQPSHPWLSGMSYLYTLEHFRLVKANLAPDGIFCQWINLFRMNAGALKSVLASFHRVFPGVHVFQTDPNSLLVLGSRRPFPVDPELIEHHLEEERLSRQASLFAVTLEDVLLSYRLTRDDVKRLVGGAPPNTDRHPIVEMGLPWVGHDTVLDAAEIFKKTGLQAHLRPAVLKATTSTPQLWSRLARSLTEGVKSGSKKPKRARAFLERWGDKFLGLEKRLLLGHVDEYVGDEAASEKHYRDLFQKGDLSAAHRLGCLLQRQGRLREALPILEEALTGAWDAESRICLAEAYLGLDAPESTRPYLEPLVLPPAQRYPEPPQRQALLLLAEVEREAGHPERAKELVSRHLQLRPSSARGYHLLAELLTLEHKTEAARRHSRKAAALDRDRAARIEDKGRRASKNGHLDTARRYFEKAIEANPRLDSPYRWLANAYRDHGHYEDLERLRREASAVGVPSHVWRDDVNNTATLAQKLGMVVAEEASRVRLLMSTRSRDTRAHKKNAAKEPEKKERLEHGEGEGKLGREAGLGFRVSRDERRGASRKQRGGRAEAPEGDDARDGASSVRTTRPEERRKGIEKTKTEERADHARRRARRRARGGVRGGVRK